MPVRQAPRAWPIHLAEGEPVEPCTSGRAQLSMLLEGIDWRRVGRTWTPEVTRSDDHHDSLVLMRVFHAYTCSK